VNTSSTSEALPTDQAPLKAGRDDEIDLSEIPEVSEEQMARAVLRIGGVPLAQDKRRITMFLDASIVDYFKAKAGEHGYQTLINDALAQYIHDHEL
jgi:uncharacterized protein (DUF4415 family)